MTAKRQWWEGMSPEELRRYMEWDAECRERMARRSLPFRINEWMETNDFLIVAIGMVFCFVGFTVCMVLWAMTA